MQERVERMVTAVLHEIERGLALVRVPARELSGAQQVERFRSNLRPTHVVCTFEWPIAEKERAELGPLLLVKMSIEIDASGVPRLQGVTAEAPHAIV
ncbi:hypothetical protein [Polyangium mundeleinium]|uniref:Uncharacterized protein n=1 Tax=Polyangium mundeleinium TaxID=2995306 RepID=A0ABT5F3K3_9BACT|nr:hypothetical protein [Polyangium mundeleinium]MDC0748686.1 hypothetical protein [Polyangium mundeleinium]